METARDGLCGAREGRRGGERGGHTAAVTLEIVYNIQSKRTYSLSLQYLGPAAVAEVEAVENVVLLVEVEATRVDAAAVVEAVVVVGRGETGSIIMYAIIVYSPT